MFSLNTCKQNMYELCLWVLSLASRGQPVTPNLGCPYMANGAYAYPPPPPANGIYSTGPPPPGYSYPAPPPPGNILCVE